MVSLNLPVNEALLHLLKKHCASWLKKNHTQLKQKNNLIHCVKNHSLFLMVCLNTFFLSISPQSQTSTKFFERILSVQILLPDAWKRAQTCKDLLVFCWSESKNIDYKCLSGSWSTLYYSTKQLAQDDEAEKVLLEFAVIKNMTRLLCNYIALLQILALRRFLKQKINLWLCEDFWLWRNL